MNNSILGMVKSEKLLTKDDIIYLMYNSENKDDLVVLNYVQTSIIDKFGKVFIQKSKDKIEFVLQILLDDNVDLMYDFYKTTSSYYLEANSDIAPFNLIFFTYIHFAMKVLRSNS